MKTLGQTIEAARKAKRISVIRLAQEIGVTRAAVYQWQRDEHPPGISHLIEISRILGISLAALGAAAHGRDSVDAELAQLPEGQADYLARSFLDQIDNFRKLQKS